MARRSVSLVAVAALSTVCLAACGGDGGGANDVATLDADTGSGDDDNGSTTASTVADEDLEEALLDWAECMREQGVDIPDPQVNDDGGIMLGEPRDPDDDGAGGADEAPFDRDSFERATEECGDPRGSGTFTEEDRAEMEADALRFAECMREQGIEDFPDPDFSDVGPGAGPRTSEDSDGGPGGGTRVGGPFGEIDLDDPEVRAAFEACQDELGGDGPMEFRAGPDSKTDS